MKIWICIPVFNRIELTVSCIKSLEHQSFRDFEIVICDDGSTDGTSDIIRNTFPEVHLLEGDGNLWWTGGINKCVEFALGQSKDNDCILTLNNDLEVQEDYLESLLEPLLKYPQTIITSVVYDINNKEKLVETGYRQNWLTTKVRSIDIIQDHISDDHFLAEVTHAAGRGTLIPVNVFREIGLYDAVNLPHYGADYDFTHRARRNGYKILISYKAKIFSHINETGLTKIRETFGLKKFYEYLTDIKSPANIGYRFKFALNNCPKALLPSFVIIDSSFVVGSYLKYHCRNIFPAIR